jgi:mono/diheme cytochrome c family protein
LSDACFQCHGPDEGQRHGGLRLDLAGAALKGGDSGPSIVPGNAEASELWKRITSTDPAIQMPPPSSVK